METNICDDDINIVESVLVKELRALAEGYESRGQNYQDDLAISALRRTLEALGRPHSCVWDSTLGKNVVNAD